MLQDSISNAEAGDRYSGHRKLWGRVVLRAIYDWVAYRDSTRLQQKKLAESAENWLFGSSELFNSFESVCDMLEVSPDVIRQSARQFTKEDVLKAEHIERTGRREEIAPVERDQTRYLVE